MQLHAEYQDQHQPEPEVRDHGHDHEYRWHDAVQPPAASPGADDPDAGAEHEGQHGGEADQAQGPWDRVQNEASDRVPWLITQGLAELARRYIAEVLEILADQALMSIEAELRFQCLERLRADPALMVGEHRERRVSRHQPRQHEVERDRHPQRQREEAKAAQHESHALLLLLTGLVLLNVRSTGSGLQAEWPADCLGGSPREPPRPVGYFFGTRCSIT